MVALLVAAVTVSALALFAPAASAAPPPLPPRLVVFEGFYNPG
jgi:hypothetical protein